MQDPFLSVQEEVKASLLSTNKQFTLWNVALNSNSQSQFRTLTQNLETSIQGIQIDIQDLTQAIQMVEMNPSKFNLTHVEISNRNRFISTTKDRVAGIRLALNSSDAQKKLADEQRQALFKSNSPSTRQNETMPDKNNTQFIDMERQNQTMMMSQQDTQMTDVLHTVGTLKEVAVVMGREIQDQTGLLNDMEVQVDSTSNKLKSGMKRMGDFMKANSSMKQQWMIIGLIIVLVLLIVVIFAL